MAYFDGKMSGDALNVVDCGGVKLVGDLICGDMPDLWLFCVVLGIFTAYFCVLSCL